MSIDVQILDPTVGSRIVTIREDGNTTQNWSFGHNGEIDLINPKPPVINIGELKWSQSLMKFSGTTQNGVRWDAVESLGGPFWTPGAVKDFVGYLEGDLTFPIDSFLPKDSNGNYGAYVISALLSGKTIHGDRPLGDFSIFSGPTNCPARFRRKVKLEIGCGVRFALPRDPMSLPGPNAFLNYAVGEVYDCTEVERKELEQVRVFAIQKDYQPQKCVNAVSYSGEPMPEYAKFGVFIEVVAKTFIFEELVLQISKI